MLASGSLAGVQPAGPEDDTVRARYRGSPDLPDGVAFHSTLRILNHFVESDDEESAVEWMAQELKLTTGQAEVFVKQAVTTLQNIDADIKTANANLACKDGIPVAYNEDVYAVLQQMYGISIQVAERHFEQMKSSLEPDTAALLQQFIDERKLNIGYTELDLEKAATKTDRYGVATLFGYCE